MSSQVRDSNSSTVPFLQNPREGTTHQSAVDPNATTPYTGLLRRLAASQEEDRASQRKVINDIQAFVSRWDVEKNDLQTRFGSSTNSILEKQMEVLLERDANLLDLVAQVSESRDRALSERMDLMEGRLRARAEEQERELKELRTKSDEAFATSTQINAFVWELAAGQKTILQSIQNLSEIVTKVSVDSASGRQQNDQRMDDLESLERNHHEQIQTQLTDTTANISEHFMRMENFGVLHANHLDATRDEIHSDRETLAEEQARQGNVLSDLLEEVRRMKGELSAIFSNMPMGRHSVVPGHATGQQASGMSFHEKFCLIPEDAKLSTGVNKRSFIDNIPSPISPHNGGTRRTVSSVMNSDANLLEEDSDTSAGSRSDKRIPHAHSHISEDLRLQQPQPTGLSGKLTPDLNEQVNPEFHSPASTLRSDPHSSSHSSPSNLIPPLHRPVAHSTPINALPTASDRIHHHHPLPNAIVDPELPITPPSSQRSTSGDGDKPHESPPSPLASSSRDLTTAHSTSHNEAFDEILSAQRKRKPTTNFALSPVSHPPRVDEMGPRVPKKRRVEFALPTKLTIKLPPLKPKVSKPKILKRANGVWPATVSIDEDNHDLHVSGFLICSILSSPSSSCFPSRSRCFVCGSYYSLVLILQFIQCDGYITNSVLIWKRAELIARRQLQL